MGITNFSALSIESGVSCGIVTTSGISLSGTGVVSLGTVTNEASIVTESLTILHQASGLSLCYRSGDTIYLFNAGSAISKAI